MAKQKKMTISKARLKQIISEELARYKRLKESDLSWFNEPEEDSFNPEAQRSEDASDAYDQLDKAARMILTSFTEEAVAAAMRSLASHVEDGSVRPGKEI